MRGRSK
ncbi:Protein of unknown function [Propionibacterium freudenreichii]|nr:Protein of unknown function [Propionibacterium freudenreichii]CEI48927.1 Protein of unknown function [Propionibacterium freudenreichii]